MSISCTPFRGLAGFACLRLAFAMAAAGWGTAGAAEKVVLTGSFPAQNAEASQLRRLSVGRFGGNSAGQIASALQAELGKAEGAEAPWFTISTGPAGRARGGAAEGVVTGNAHFAVEETQVERRTFDCAEWAGKKCLRYRTVACTVRLLNLAVDVQIERVRDNRIVYSGAKPIRDEISWCAGGVPPRTAQESLMQMALLSARQIKREVSPYTETYTVKLKEDTDGMAKPAKNRFKAAVKTSEKDLQGSCATWESLRAEGSRNASLLFNLGVCAETRGDFDAAGAFYAESQSLVADGSKRTAEATSRVRLLAAAKQQALQQQVRRQSSEAGQAKADAQAEREAKNKAAAEARQKKLTQDRLRAQAAAQAAAQVNAERTQRVQQRQKVVAKHGAASADAIIAGRVEKGMSASQVQAAIGAPSRRERISPGEEQWFYPGRRVVFSAGRVSYVGK
jgi:hypothetical protein